MAWVRRGFGSEGRNGSMDDGDMHGSLVLVSIKYNKQRARHIPIFSASPSRSSAVR